MEATASYCKAANVCHGSEFSRLDGEQDCENSSLSAVAAGWYN